MKERWFADDRDLVKWSAVLHLARERKLTRVIQAAYLRDDERPRVAIGDQMLPVNEAVWTFFRDLRRIRDLGRVVGIPIDVIADRFDPRAREDYRALVCSAIRRGAPGPILLFLDPDTGLQPERSGAEHVTHAEVREYWTQLHPGDWLALYQHARRSKTWREDVAGELAEMCASQVIVATSNEIGKDVALLFVAKT